MTTLRLREAAATINASNTSDAEKNAMMTEMVAAAAREPVPDTWVYRIVVLAIGLAIFVPLLALLFGTPPERKMEMAQLLLPIGTTALGALAGLLAPSPASNS